MFSKKSLFWRERHFNNENIKWQATNLNLKLPKQNFPKSLSVKKITQYLNPCNYKKSFIFKKNVKKTCKKYHFPNKNTYFKVEITTLKIFFNSLHISISKYKIQMQNGKTFYLKKKKDNLFLDCINKNTTMQLKSCSEAGTDKMGCPCCMQLYIS